MKKDDKIGVIKQDGRVIGAIFANQTIKWDSPLEGNKAGLESRIENVVASQKNGISSIAAVYAVLILQEAFAKTSLSFDLIVDLFYGIEPDVIIHDNLDLGEAMP